MGTRNRTTLHWRTPNHAHHAVPSRPASRASGSRPGPVSAGSASATVEGVDLVAEVAHHDVALELQRRREVAGLLGEVAVDDGELPDRLGLGDRPVRVVD